MSDNTERRDYALRWTLSDGTSGETTITATVDNDFEQTSELRVMAYAHRWGSVWAATEYVAVMRAACDVLTYKDVASFYIERGDVAFPPLVTIAAPFAYEKLYALVWPDGDASQHVEHVTVSTDPDNRPFVFAAEGVGRSCGARSPIVALYATACEMLCRSPVETFSIVEAS